MHRYGYAPNAKTGIPQGPTIGQQNNVFFLKPDEFQKVQGRLIDAHAKQLPSPQPEPAKENEERPASTNTEKV
jgi:hypothetical protein